MNLTECIMLKNIYVKLENFYLKLWVLLKNEYCFKLFKIKIIYKLKYKK